MLPGTRPLPGDSRLLLHTAQRYDWKDLHGEALKIADDLLGRVADLKLQTLVAAQEVAKRLR